MAQGYRSPIRNEVLKLDKLMETAVLQNMVRGYSTLEEGITFLSGDGSHNVWGRLLEEHEDKKRDRAIEKPLAIVRKEYTPRRRTNAAAAPGDDQGQGLSLVEAVPQT